MIPDLEATAVVRLVSVADGSEAACLKVDLSNGKTTRHAYVAWALGGLALGSIAVGVLGGSVDTFTGRNVGPGRRKERLVALLTFFQFVATTGMLSLDYPLVFTSFTSNFAWTLGLIASPRFQAAIDDARRDTGGKGTTLAGGTTANFRSDAAMSIPDVQETNLVDSVNSGLPRYLANLGILPANGFFTQLINFLLLCCMFLAIALLLVLAYLLIVSRMSKTVGARRLTPQQLSQLVGANAVRLVRPQLFFC